MKKLMIVILVVAVLLLAGGIVGKAITYSNYESNLSDDESLYCGGMMYDDDDAYYRGGGMMREYFDDSDDEVYDGEKMQLDELTPLVEEYISEYADGLAINEVITPDNGNYYFVIIDKESGDEVMGLTVNPYTGEICPTYGMMGRGYCSEYDVRAYSDHGMFSRRGR